MSQRIRLFPTLLPILTALVYGLTAIGRAIADADEGLYAHIPQQMLERGDWITPHANGVPFFGKPPLLYWMIALCYRILGTHEFAARVPSILAVVGTAWLVQRMASLAVGSRASVSATAAFAFCIGTYLFTLEVMHDILLVFFITLAIYCFLLAYKDQESPIGPVLGFFAAAAGAFLSKGLLGLVFPVAIAALYILLSRDTPPLRLRALLPGFLIFLALVSPWYVAMELENPGFLRIHFVEEQLLRFFEQREPLDYESIPLPLFWGLLPVWFFPWCVFLPAAFVMGRSDDDREWVGRTRRLAACWALLILLFFSASSRLEHYAFPLLPPLALLVGITFASENAGVRRAIRWGFVALGVLGILLLLGTLVLLIVAFGGPEMRADEAAHPDSTFNTDFAIMFEMPGEIIADLLRPAIGITFAMGIFFLAAPGFGLRQRYATAVLILTLAMVCFHFAAGHSLGVVEEIVSSKKIGRALAEIHEPGERVVILGDYESANSINFYAPARLMVCGGSAASIASGLPYSGREEMVITTDRLRTLWDSGRRVFLVGAPERMKELGLHPVHEIIHVAGRSLYSNQ